jgi:uncharacterized protein YbaA (DUF1428 family)
MTYVAGFLIPVPDGKKEAYVESARKAWEIFREYGATEVMEAWGDEVPEGKRTDFRRAVDLQEGETVCFSWMVWPDKETFRKCEASMETDSRWQEMGEMPFDGKRMIWGSFVPVFEARA